MGKTIERRTCEATSIVLSPLVPTAEATTAEGMTPRSRVMSRRRNGDVFQLMKPSETTWPARVAVMDAL